MWFSIDFYIDMLYGLCHVEQLSKFAYVIWNKTNCACANSIETTNTSKRNDKMEGFRVPFVRALQVQLMNNFTEYVNNFFMPTGKFHLLPFHNHVFPWLFSGFRYIGRDNLPNTEWLHHLLYG